VAHDFATKVKIARALADGASRDDAARIGGVDRSTLFRYLADDEEMRDAIAAVEFIDKQEAERAPLVPLPGKSEGRALAPKYGTEVMNDKIRRAAGRIVWTGDG
jgi:hypothetical protein